jgi:hypothetical protein
MERTKTYTMEELHRMDPSQLISHDGHRPMQVNEVIQHLCRGDWPDPEIRRSLTQQEVLTTTPREPEPKPTQEH